MHLGLHLRYQGRGPAHILSIYVYAHQYSGNVVTLIIGGTAPSVSLLGLTACGAKHSPQEYLLLPP